MTQGCVLVVWEHGGNLGHLARLLPVLQTLQTRGHAVVFAVAQPTAVESLLAHTAIKVVRAPQAAVPMVCGSIAVCPADIWLRCGFASPPLAMACVIQWLALFDGLKPTAILVDASPIALYAAHLAGISTLALGHGFELPASTPGLSFVPWQSDQAATIAYSERVLESALIGLAISLAAHLPAASNRVHRLRQATSVGKLLGLSQQALCTWPELDHFDRDSAAAKFVGPIWSDLPGTTPLAWPEKPGPKVLCYLTLTDKRYDLLWQALRKHGTNVLVLSPSGNDRACQAARGWGITVCQHPVALSDLLRDCYAVIGHGGMGFTSMALHAGKPLLLLPTQFEQSLLAFQLEKKGLAINTATHVNKLTVQARVAQLLDDVGLKDRAGWLSRQYAEFSPQQAINRVVTQLVRSPA